MIRHHHVRAYLCYELVIHFLQPNKLVFEEDDMFPARTKVIMVIACGVGIAAGTRVVRRPPRRLRNSALLSAPGQGEKTLDLALIAAEESPRWSRVWPGP